MDILVTGGAGFIGSHLCDVLVSAGYRVLAVDNLSLGRLENIADLLGVEAFEFQELDILDDRALDKVCRGRNLQTVFHMAANSDIAQSHQNPR